MHHIDVDQNYPFKRMDIIVAKREKVENVRKVAFLKY